MHQVDSIYKIHKICLPVTSHFLIKEMVWQWEFLAIISEVDRLYVEASFIVNLTMRNNIFVSARYIGDILIT